MNTTPVLKALACAFTLSAAAAAPMAFGANSTEASCAESSVSATEMAIEDAWLDGKLETSLLFNQYVNSFDIDTEVRGGTAYLKGAVESDIDRDLAGEIAKSIKGIDSVQNDLVVDKAQADVSRDSAVAQENASFVQGLKNAGLTASVKSKLLLNSNTSGMAIDVDSADGVVTLTGKVNSSEEKELAVRIAGNTEGATSVRDHLLVEPQSQG